MSETFKRRGYQNFSSIILKYQEVPALLVFVVLFTFFSIFAPNFMTLKTVADILAIVADFGIIGIGVTLLMISGEFDLSIGSIFVVCGFIFGELLNAFVPLLISIIITLLFGILAGFINGIIITKTKVSSVIVTLGMMWVWRMTWFFFGGYQTYLPDSETPYFRLLNQNMGGGFRTTIFWFLILLVIFQFILFKTKFGNSVFAVGGNPEVARAMGINVDRIKIINFMIVGALTALSSCFDFARYRFLDFFSNVNMPLQIIAVVVIGGTLLIGGRGSIIGTFLGASILAMFSSGLILLGVNTYYYRTFVGLLLILAAIIYSVITRRFEKL